MTNLHWNYLCSATVHPEHRPIFAFPEERADRHFLNMFRIPSCDVDNHTVIVPKCAPFFRRFRKIDGYTHPLLFNSERRHLQKASRVDARDPALKYWSTPAIDADRKSVV